MFFQCPTVLTYGPLIDVSKGIWSWIATLPMPSPCWFRSIREWKQKKTHSWICSVANSLFLFLQYNASVKICDAEGRSSLFYARTAGDKEVVELLLQNGCPDSGVVVPPLTPHTPALTHSTLPLSSNTNSQPSTLPRRKGSISRKPDLDKLQASVI